MQIAYYDQRGRKHRQTADRTLTMGGFAAALGAVASGSADVVASFTTPWASLAALGVTGTALEILRGRLDDVRRGVLAGSQQVLEEYVAAVQDPLSVEHREWLSGAESTRSAIGGMDETLAALQKGEAKAQGAG